MKRNQAIKFWNALDASTNINEVISSFENKHGYDGKRTLQRYTQAHKGFRQGLSLQNISSKTGWGKSFVDKLEGWWKGEFTPLANTPRKTNGEVFSNSQERYSEEWNHYHKIKESIIRLQHPSGIKIRELLDIIERERVTLDDSKLQNDLDEFIAAVQESVDLYMSIPPITQVINRTSRRMNKRYPRK